MSKRKLEGNDEFSYLRQRSMYIPSPPRKGPSGTVDVDPDIENIAYRDDEDNERPADHTDGGEGEEDEVDPLDAFMAGIHQEVAADSKKEKPAQPKPRREDLEGDEEDPMESFLAARKNAGLSLAADVLAAGYNSDEEVYAAAKAVDAGTVEYDDDDNPIVAMKRDIEPLPPVDHTLVDYDDFNKEFYEEHPEVTALPEAEILAYRKELGIRVSGFDVPRPVTKFEQLGFDDALLGVIAKQGYKKPTPIQSQALPIVLSGRDVIGVAKTGSGKTAAYLLPMIVHIMDQAELKKGEGPIGVVLAPTRELAQQIYTEAKRFSRAHGLRVSGVYGGMSKFEQFKELKAGCEIVVATPGRLIDMIKMKAVSLSRTTYIVLDEADHMLDLGFEPQVRSVVGQIRPERQTLLYSATMPRRVERLARDIVGVPVRITVGEVGKANEDITQHVQVVPSDADKLPWLVNHLPERIDEGEVLIFASTKARVEELEGKISAAGFRVGALHGDKDQATRMDVLKSFKDGQSHVLVATDVAARGLDIKNIKSVINYDMAKDMDAHVHRIGRTGRAGDKSGVAITLLTQKEARLAGELVGSLIAAGQVVSPELTDLAMKDGRFRSQREGRSGKGGRGRGKGGRGGGGGGRGQRGVDFGLGLGYGSEAPGGGGISAGAAPPARTVPSSPAVPVFVPSSSPANGESGVPNRGTAVGYLKTGMMAKFRSSFVAASVGGSSASYTANVNQGSGSAESPGTGPGAGSGTGQARGQGTGSGTSERAGPGGQVMQGHVSTPGSLVSTPSGGSGSGAAGLTPAQLAAASAAAVAARTGGGLSGERQRFAGGFTPGSTGTSYGASSAQRTMQGFVQSGGSYTPQGLQGFSPAGAGSAPAGMQGFVQAHPAAAGSMSGFPSGGGLTGGSWGGGQVGGYGAGEHSSGASGGREHSRHGSGDRDRSSRWDRDGDAGRGGERGGDRNGAEKEKDRDRHRERDLYEDENRGRERRRRSGWDR